jgi:hypothetical protein
MDEFLEAANPRIPACINMFGETKPGCPGFPCLRAYIAWKSGGLKPESNQNIDEWRK